LSIKSPSADEEERTKMKKNEQFADEEERTNKMNR